MSTGSTNLPAGLNSTSMTFQADPAAAAELGKEKEQPAAGSSSYLRLSFVHINNPNEKKLASKRRAVRSHVAYYQHHKDDDNGGSKRPSRRGRGKQHSGTKSPTRSEAQTELGSSAKLDTSFVSVQESQLSPVSADGFPELSLSTISTPSSRRSSWYEDESIVNSRRNSTASLQLPNSSSSYSLPNFFQGTRVDPFQSYPIPWRPEYTPIFDYYTQEICNDIPSIYQTGKAFPLRSVWLPFVISSPKTLYAALCVGATLIHYQHGNNTEKPAVLFDLRSKAVAAINENLDDPMKQLDDENILAVGLMAVVESLGGDILAYDIHMTGLSRMLRMRGGVKTLPLNGLCASILIWLDCSHARMHNSPVYLFESSEVAKRLSLPSSASSSSLASLSTLRRGETDLGLERTGEGEGMREVADVSLLTWPRLLQWVGHSAEKKGTRTGHKWHFAAVCAESVFHSITQVVEDINGRAMSI